MTLVRTDLTVQTVCKLSSQFPLYTLMVFDEWHNGIPVAFILTSRCAEADLTPWMAALNEKMVGIKPEWKPAAFIVDCAQGEINAIKYVIPLHVEFSPIY